MMSISTCFHWSISSCVRGVFLLRKAALAIVIPLNADAADPVHTVKRNVRSLYNVPIFQQNSKQNCCTSLIAVVLPAPALPVKKLKT